MNASTIIANLKRRGATTFAALRHRNYRLWFVGQTISLMGTWMQSVAQQYLVYYLTGSKLALGTVTFFGTLPTIFLMIPGGALADRVNKRRLLLLTQSAMMVLAFMYSLLAGTHVLQVWHIILLAIGLGFANSFDAPARQALAIDMVEDRRDLMNAIALNSTIFNLARVIGPTIGGILLAAVGPTWCFAMNGLSFLAVIFALTRMRMPTTVRKEATGEKLSKQVKEGLAYIVHQPLIRTIIILVAVASTFGTIYIILLAAYASDVLHDPERGLGFIQMSLGIGALIGSLIVASIGRSQHARKALIFGSIFFPLAVLAFSLTRSLWSALVVLPMVGFGLVTQNATCNTVIQATVPDELRGRVMAVYMLMFFGTTPLSSLIAGTLGQALGVNWAIGIGGAITLVSSLFLIVTVPALRKMESVEPAAAPARPLPHLQADVEEVEG